MDLINDRRYRIESDGSSFFFIIEYVESQDEGRYICLVNLKCWRRIVDKLEIVLVVIGGN